MTELRDMKRGLGSGTNLSLSNYRKLQRIHCQSSRLRFRLRDKKDKRKHEQIKL